MTARELAEQEGISLSAAKMRLYRQRRGGDAPDTNHTAPIDTPGKREGVRVDLSPLVERLDYLQEMVESLQGDVAKLLRKAGEW